MASSSSSTFKFDQRKIKHQLLYISINLCIILSCMLYMQNNQNWLKIGKFSNSVLPIVLIGEILKIILTKYLGRNEKETTVKLKQRNSSNYNKNLTIRDILGGILLQTICTILYAFLCIILGAPVLYDYEETFVLATLLTLMTISPIVLLFGGSGTLQICFCEKYENFLTKSEEISINLHKYHMIGTIFGAWAGSIVSPLDWDREWQLYPIPNIIGGLFGCGIFNMYACTKVLYYTGKVVWKKRL